MLKKKGNKIFIEGDSVRIEITQRNGNVLNTYISIEDYDKVITNFNYTWYAHWHETSKAFYIEATVYLGMDNGKEKSKTERLHTFLLNPEHNPNIVIDHIDHNTLNNRRSNLRISTIQENDKHRKSKNSNNKSGYRNVFWNKDVDKWSVRLSKNYKQIYLGDYDDIHEAGRVAEEGRQKYYGDYAGKN